MARDVRINTRLLAGFATLMALLVVLATILAVRVDGIDDPSSTISTVNSVKQLRPINFPGSVHDRAIAPREPVLLSAPAARQAPLADITRLSHEHARSAGPLDAMRVPNMEPSAEQLRILISIKDTERRTLPVVQAVIARKQRGEDTGAERFALADQPSHFKISASAAPARYAVEPAINASLVKPLTAPPPIAAAPIAPHAWSTL